MTMTKEEIAKLMDEKNKRGFVAPSYFKKYYPEIYDEIDATYDDTISFVEKLYCHVNNVTPYCANGEKRKFMGYKHGYYHSVATCVCDKNCRTNARKETMLERHGVEHALQSDVFQNKCKETLKKNYGVETVHAAGREKRIATNLERYGVEHPLQSKSIQEKISKTNIERYDVSKPFQLSSVQKKIQSSWLEINGTLSYVKTPEQIQKQTKEERIAKFGEYAESVISDSGKLSDLLRSNTRQAVADILGCSKRLIDKLVIAYNLEEFKSISYYEVIIDNYLKELGIENVVRNTRKIIAPKELDFYLPDYNVAIEVNGLKWHAEGLGKDSKYHLDKLNACKKQGVELIHIFQDEMDNSLDIVKSIIASKLNKITKVVYARNTIVKEIPYSDAAEFLNKNHLQRASKGTFCNLGLFDKQSGDLVSVMTFKTGARGIELSRFVTRTGTQVVGGANKLFKYFVKTHNNVDKIYTYSDKRYFTGNVYEHLGFERKTDTQPGYWYFKGTNKREHRLNYTKSALLKKYPGMTGTESEIMKQLGYDRIWDCGNYSFEWNRHLTVYQNTAILNG